MTGPAADGGKSVNKKRALTREERRAAELRANLARRKAQARARIQMQGPGSTTPEAERPDED